MASEARKDTWANENHRDRPVEFYQDLFDVLWQKRQIEPRKSFYDRKKKWMKKNIGAESATMSDDK